MIGISNNCMFRYGLWSVLLPIVACLSFPAAATSLSLSYDLEGRLLGATDNTTGQVAQYAYDANGNLTGGTKISPITGTLTLNAPATNETDTIAGQADLLNFSVSSPQTLTLNVGYVSGSLSGATILVLGPNGVPLSNGSLVVQNCPSACSGSATLTFNATQSGTYQVVVMQPQASPGTGTLNFAVQPVPTLPEWGVLLFGTLLMGTGLRRQGLLPRRFA